MRTARWLALIALAGCSHAFSESGQRDGKPGVYALLINGGATAAANYLSHLHHLADMHGVLRARGVPADRIAVLASDGDLPFADAVASRPADGPGAWLLQGTVLERAVGNPIRYLNTDIRGVTTRPASFPELESWFAAAGRELRPGDTLVLFVTDHGQRGSSADDARITLWRGHSVSVRELAGMLDQLAPGVRVVAVMSQCFSGAFAEAMLRPGSRGRAVGSTCGYFSTTADRMAYGCYPESRDRDVGHAFSFIAGLRRTRSLADAHAETLLTDRTPDVPLRSSDVYAERFLARVAERRHQSVDQLLAAELAAGLPEDAGDRSLVDRVAVSFAVPLLFDPGEIAATGRRLDDLEDRLDAGEDAWRVAVGELAQANLSAFLAARPAWGPQLQPDALVRIPIDRLDAFQAAFLHDLVGFTDASPGRLERLRAGHDHWTAVAAAAQRARIRAAALLRLRTLMASLVARRLLQKEGSPTERADYAALRACEDLELPGGPSAPLTRFPKIMPAISSDERVAVSLVPASLGAVVTDLPSGDPTRNHLPGGAMSIAAVDPGSPAEQAGLRAGDVLLGAPGEPVVDRGAMKLFLAGPRGMAERELEILRGGQRLVVRATPVPSSGNRDVPGLKAAARAALDGLIEYRGPLASTLSARRPFLLFFWATWCGVCKRSIPELMALQKARHLPIIAITDEPSEVVDAFLQQWSGGFPEIIAQDPGRRVNETFEVEALPTYVLVDEFNRVPMRSLGYNAARGLPIPGWQRP